MAYYNEIQFQLPVTVQEALEWFRAVFVKIFAQGGITKRTFCRIAEDDEEFFGRLFNLIDSDESGTVCYQEFSGGLLRLDRGREMSEEKLTHLTRTFIVSAGPDGQVNKTEFIDLCKQMTLSEHLYDLFDVDNSGELQSSEFLIALDKLARSNNDVKWYSWAEKWFSQHASRDGRITKEKFLELLNVKVSCFAERLFDVVDSDHSGCVDVTELMNVFHVLTYGFPKQRLLVLFKVYDIDGNGRLKYEELKTVLEWSFADSSLEIKDDLVEKLTETLFNKMDLDRSGDISLTEFEIFLNQYPQITKHVTISFPNCLRPVSKMTSPAGEKLRKKMKRTLTIVNNNKPILFFWILYFAVIVTLFTTEASKYWSHSNVYFVIARGCGQCLNFVSSFTVVFMFRYIITYLRSSRFRQYLPLDHAIKGHSFTGFIIFLFAILHGAMHVKNADILCADTNEPLAKYLFTLHSGVGWVEGSACLTGWILVLLLMVLLITAHSRIRRNGYFQVFYWSHWTFLVWWAVLVIHASRFWMWLVGPASLYILEKLWRHVRSKHKTCSAIKSIRSVNSQVSEVLLERPKYFKFSAGDYIFVLIPAVAKFEWHPFTISSAPEETGFLSLHIKAVGDWTKEVRALGESWTRRLDQTTGQLPSLSPRNCNANFRTRDRYSETAPQIYGYSNAAFDGDNTDAVGLRSTLISYSSPRDTPTFMDFIRAHDTSISRLTLRSSDRIAGELSETQPEKDYAQVNKIPDFKLQVEIDGPYGSPTTTVYDVDHAILIGGGIGVTPFASILKSIMIRRQRQRSICPNCNYWWTASNSKDLESVPNKITHLHLYVFFVGDASPHHQVDFVWVTRTFDRLEWFLGVLSDLEEEQDILGPDEHFLDLRLFVTSALVRSDIRATALQMALELCHKEEARDPLCGLRTRVQPGRPNWRKVLENILLYRTEGKVCVFFCGPPQLEKVVKKISLDLKLDFRVEIF